MSGASIAASGAAAAGGQSHLSMVASNTLGGGLVGYSGGVQALANDGGTLDGTCFGTQVFLIATFPASPEFYVRMAGTVAANFWRTIKILNQAGTSVLGTVNSGAMGFATANTGPGSAAASTWSSGIAIVGPLNHAQTYQVQFFR